MKSLKNQKGITLVALVITIIVLLILAGVSLSLVAGENGILSKATKAVDVTAESTAKEEVQVLVSDAAAAYYQIKYAADTTTETTEAANVGSYVAGKIDDKTTNSGYKVEVDSTTIGENSHAKITITGKNLPDAGINMYLTAEGTLTSTEPSAGA